MERKYILICHNISSTNESLRISNLIDKIADNWFKIGDINDSVKTILFTINGDDKKYKTSEIRDELNNISSCNTVVIEIEPTGNTATHGEFATGTHWDWISKFVKKDKQLIDDSLPDAKLNYNKEENYI